MRTRQRREQVVRYLEPGTPRVGFERGAASAWTFSLWSSISLNNIISTKTASTDHVIQDLGFGSESGNSGTQSDDRMCTWSVMPQRPCVPEHLDRPAGSDGGCYFALVVREKERR